MGFDGYFKIPGNNKFRKKFYIFGKIDIGFLLTRKCIESGIETECLPGATALIPALVNSGFPCDRFCFEGFLPQKKGRNKKLNALKEENKTLILYESPHRIMKTVEQMMEVFGKERKICIAREISKIHEEYKRGSIEEICEYCQTNPLKGEIVILIEPLMKNKTSDKKIKDV